VGVICGSASKAYSMTGWRCGWTIGPEPLIAASSALQSHATSNASSITQKAVTAALNGSQEPVRVMLDEYRTRRDRLYEWLTADPRVKCHKPGGAFYMFVDISDVLTASGLKSSTEFAAALLEDAKVAVTPGESFGAPGFVRISYATSMDNLREGSRLMLEFVRVRTSSAAATR
jgi:aspartate aminotransferase